MDELQILIKAIMTENSEQNLDSELRILTKRLSDAHKISLKVGIDQASVKTVKSELQTIAKQVQSASTSSKSGSGQIKVFDKTQLEADGQKYFNYVRNIVARVQKEFGKMGQVDVTNVFKNAKGEIQSFTASVTKADGVVEKFNFELAKIKNGSRNLSGFVQTNSILSDKRAGSDLEKTLNFLNRIDNKIADISSKTLKNTSKPLLGDMEQYNQYQTRLNEVKARIEEIKKANATLSGDHKREIASMVADLQRYAKELQKSAYAATDLNAATFQNKKSELQAALKTDIQKWQDSGIFGGTFEQDVNKAKRALDDALDPTDLEAYKHQLSLIVQQVKQLKLDDTASGRLIDADILNNNIQTAQNRILNLRETYSAFLDDPNLVAKWEALFESSKIVDSKKKLQELNSSIRKFEQELISAGKHQRSFFDELKANAVKMGTWMILGGVIAGITRGVTGLYGAVVDLDSAMTELKKVTDETDAAYNRFLTDAAEKAVKIGTTYSDYVNSTASFARLGYTIGDAAKLAEVANIYAVVGDEISGVDEATTSIISTMKAFGIEAENAMTIVDKFNEVGNNFAISSGGIGDAMQRSAAALAAANNTIDQSIALIVAANNVVQDPETVGTMWKTVSMRIRGAKTELEEAGLETEYMAESVATLRKQIKGLTNVNGTGGFDIMLDENTFKSTYDIILGISKVWKNMSDIDQSALLELLAGKRQGNALAATLTNMKDAEAALKKSVTSEGSALKEHEKVMDSIQAKQKAFQAQYQALANSILNSDLIKGMYDGGTGLLGWLTKATELAGGLPVALSAITPFINKLQMFKTVTNEDGGKGILTVFGANKLALDNDIKLLGEYNDKIKKLGNSKSDLSKKQIIWNDTIGKGTSRLREQIKISDKAVVSTDNYSNAVSRSAKETVLLGVKSTAAAIGVEVLNTALNMLIGFGVGLAINAIVSGISSLVNKTKEAKEAAIEAGDAATENANTLYDLTSSYIAMCKAVDDGTGSQEDLNDIQSSLIEHLKEQGVVVQGLSGDYQNLRDSVIGAAQAQIQTSISQAIRASDIKKEDAINKLDGYFNQRNMYSATGKEAGDAMEYLKKLGFTGIDNSGSRGGGTIFLPSVYRTNGGTEDIEFADLMANYKYLESAMNAVREKFGKDNPLFTVLSDAFTEYQTAMKDAIKQIDSTNQLIVDNLLLTAQKTTQPQTLEEFTKFRQDLIDAVESSSDFDADGTYTAEKLVDTALQSAQQYQGFITQLEASKSEGIAQVEKAVTNLTERVKEMQAAYKVLETAQQEMASGAGLSAETIQALADVNENYLDFLYEENGVIKLNTDAWQENANSKMESEMLDIEREIRELQEQNSELEKQNQTLSDNIDLYEEQRALGNDGGMWNQLIVDTTNSVKENNDAIETNNARIRENQGLLAVYGSLYGSITGDMTAYSQALKNFDNVATTIDSVAASFASLANLQNTVADGFTLSLEKILEYAKAYPQILDSATVTADGELALNEAVVNSFIEGKKAELNAQIDSQIAQLEADKAVLMAKKEFAQSQLELAQAVGTGEGQISKEVAEYRINAGNAMAEALIAMKMDEANAYRLTAAAMAGNEQEFARIAAECFENVDSNSVKAAYDMANAFFTNSQNATLSIASIAEQAHQTAAAVAGMANGVVAGSSNSVFYGSGGVYTGSYGFSGVNGNFQGVDLDYQSKTASLDDYISQLQLDISDYTDAIAQIDGQIATLQALKGTPLDKFQNLVSNAADIVGGKNSGSGSSSGGSNKADEAQKLVDEYVAAIDQYYEALKRLEEAQERRKSLEKKLEHTDDFSEKIYIAGDLAGAYEAEKEAENNLMAAKQATIAANVSALRNLGFDVDYDSSTNKLFIKNLEHLNELTASTIGEYETLQDATNALRKDTEELIDATEQLNSDNIDATETIEDLGYQILETKNDIVSYIEEIYKKQTEAYREIIDTRKELIQSAKDEYDYESDVADKVKEIADLQSRIDQLSLDDSRSALAERRALEEELAKLQSDLSKTQEDHSTNAQLDALDKMADDYEQTVEDDIEKLKQTVNSTSDVWNAFYDTILGKNVSVGDSIDAEIADAWLRAAQAVQVYGASVDGLPGISTSVTSLPKYHDGGVVTGSNLGNDELLAVLKEGEIVFTKEQLISMIESAGSSVRGVIESAVQNMVRSIPAVSNVVKSITNDNSATDNSSEVISPHIEINFTHSGFMSESDMKKYSEQFADYTIGQINEVFRRKGIINNRRSRLRPG